jgi:type II secretory pathway pseudopilin PulG
MSVHPSHRLYQAGFALTEVTLALLLISLLATLALPRLVHVAGSATLRVAALHVSALLREDRNAALGSGQTSTLAVDQTGHRVRSLTLPNAVDMPAGTRAMLQDAPAGIRFYGDGRASGGSITLMSATSRYVVSINPDTGAIHVFSP